MCRTMLIALAGSVLGWSSLSAQCEPKKLIGSEVSVHEDFGFSVDVEGEVAIVGVRRAHDVGPETGAAYIFRFDGAEWLEEAHLTAIDAQPGDRFGISVAIDGDVAVVGATFADPAGEQSGSAYVFRRVAGEWQEEAELSPTSAGSYDGFGVVDVTGDVIAVGAPGFDSPAASSGAVFVFRHDGSTWTEEATLTGGVNPFAAFATVVAAGDDLIVVGAPHDGLTDAFSGMAYVFRYDGATWLDEATLEADVSAAGDFFGSSISIDGDRLLIGAVEACPCALIPGVRRPGSAYVFHQQGGLWTQEAHLEPADGERLDFFGISVALDAEHALIGSRANDLMPIGEPGAAYLFRRVGVTWEEVAILSPDEGTPLDNFGFAVGLSGPHVVVGAPRDSELGECAGAAYAFRIDVSDCEGFSRGDANGDGFFDISDAIFTLSGLFVLGSPPPGCRDAADSNDDGALDIADAAFTLSALFVPGARPLPLPHPACGPDPTPDPLDCAAIPLCP